jgi:peroxiredoxin
MKDYKMKIFLFFIYFTMTLFAQSESASDYINTTLVKVGDKAPEIQTRTLSGENFVLSQQKGKVVLVMFFATWCTHCLAELPQIEEKIYNVLKTNKDFKLIVIGRKHNKSELEKFKETKKFSLPFAPDPKTKIYSKYATKYIPRSFVIGKDGKIKFISKGSEATSVEDIFQAIKNELDLKG